jgi:tRNA-modifying protein YgfZ
MATSQILQNPLPLCGPQVLADRGVVEVTGRDAERFFNGLITNAVPPCDEDATVFAGLLSPQGKIQFEFLLHAGAGVYRLDTARDRAGELIKRLTLYRLRADVVLTDRSADYAVVTGGNNAARPDPRHPGLPTRTVRALADAAQLPRDGGYHARRIAVGVPEGGHDFGWNEVFPHEALYDRLHGVDFAKGCYVGQEIVSRMQHRGTARSRFLPVTASGPLPPMGTEVRAGDALLGTMGSHGDTTDGGIGLALLRLDRLRDALSAGTPLRAADATLSVREADIAAFAGGTA